MPYMISGRSVTDGMSLSASKSKMVDSSYYTTLKLQRHSWRICFVYICLSESWSDTLVSDRNLVLLQVLRIS